MIDKIFIFIKSPVFKGMAIFATIAFNIFAIYVKMNELELIEIKKKKVLKSYYNG